MRYRSVDVELDEVGGQGSSGVSQVDWVVQTRSSIDEKQNRKHEWWDYGHNPSIGGSLVPKSRDGDDKSERREQ